MAGPGERMTAMTRLAAAYASHQVRRWSGRARPGGLKTAADLYSRENYVPLTAAERALLPEISRCINCGICAMVAGRLGSAHLPDLASAYLRPLHLLPRAAEDLEGQGAPDLEAAAAACPVGVPLPAVAVMVSRLARR